MYFRGVEMLKLININQLSAIIDVPTSTIYGWTSSGKIPYLKVNGALRFDLEDVLQYFKKKAKRD